MSRAAGKTHGKVAIAFGGAIAIALGIVLSMTVLPSASREDGACVDPVFRATGAELVGDDVNGVTDLYVVQVEPPVGRRELTRLFNELVGFYRSITDGELAIAIFDEEQSAGHFVRIMRGFVAANWELEVDMDRHWLALYSSHHFAPPDQYREIAWLSPRGRPQAHDLTLSRPTAPACVPPWAR